MLAFLLVAEHAAAADYHCVPLEISVLSNSVRVLCAKPQRSGYPRDAGNEIKYFAVGRTSSVKHKLFYQMANIALTSGLLLRFSYTSGDTTGTTFGCVATNCRTPNIITLRKTGVVPAP